MGVFLIIRLKKNASPKLLTERLQKVSIHEVGHNLGLDHCTKNSECMMSAANGTIKQVDLEKIMFCDNCRNIIGI
jgi:archaemetzincin